MGETTSETAKQFGLTSGRSCWSDASLARSLRLKTLWNGQAMKERDLYRQISKTTGESMRTIAALGFTSLEPLPPENEPQQVDWDDLDRERTVSVMPPQERVPAVA